MKGKYNLDKFNQNADETEVLFIERVNLMFQNIEERIDKDEEVSEGEIFQLCSYVYVSDRNVSEKVYNKCNNFLFRKMYLTYFFDLSGGSKYFKPLGLKLVEIPIEIAQSELKYLSEDALQWESFLSKTQTDALVIEAKREYDFELKQFKKECPEYKNKFIFGGRRIYEEGKKQILLQNKYIYLSCKELLENYKAEDLKMNLNNREIVMNEFSFFHIYNRHFGESSKPYRSKKSFHIESADFHPNYLNIQLKDVFHDIDRSGYLSRNNLKEIFFKIYTENNVILYKIYTTSNDFVSNILISTFFPIEDINVLNDIDNRLNYVRINEGLGVYY
ncbi:hypothetical protein FM120_11280 [Sphingobacterium faecium PCAi_F2.5]|nr:hypothetical protein FM120_11280 [Sphingobacterium faecium PCAi_F2.5]